VSGWRPNEYWLTTSRLWSRANWARSFWWRDNVRNTLSDIVGMSVHDAVQHGLDFFGIDSPSAHTRANLETWLTKQRADTNAGVDWTYINLTTQLMLCPEFNLA